MCPAAVWAAAVMCLCGVLHATPPGAHFPPLTLLYPSTASHPTSMWKYSPEGEIKTWRVGPRPQREAQYFRNSLISRMQHRVKRQEVLEAANSLPHYHDAEMMKRAISLWVALHPLTSFPSPNAPAPRAAPTPHKDTPARSYGHPLRWGR